jgi:membrane protein DedA with SNARE-associated domain
LVDLNPAYFQALAIAFGMFVGAGLGLPFPEEILIIGAGVWTAANPEYGVFRWLMLPVCITGVLIADILLYIMGRVFGTRLLQKRWMRWMLPEDKRHKIEKNFHEYGVSILLFGRLLPGVRLPLFLTAGILRLPVPRFIVADGLGAILGNSILYFLAFWFGDSVRDWIRRGLDASRPLVIILAIAGVATYLLIHFLRKPVTEGDPKELPIIGKTIADHMSADVKVKKEPVDLAPTTGGSIPNGEAVKTEQKETQSPPAAPGA